MSLTLAPEISSRTGEADDIDRQLARLLQSHHFSRSTRYPALLQFLVQQVQMGNASRLKERLIGVEVFHRTPDYDTSSDPVVRVTAAEVRKRIAQYYQEPEHLNELRIDLPIGSYIPRFLPGRSLLSSPAHGTASSTPDLLHTEAESVPNDHEIGIATDTTISLAAGTEETLHLESNIADWPSQLTKTASPEDSHGSFISRKRKGLLLSAAVLLGMVLAGLPLAVNALRDSMRTRAVRQLWAPMVAQGRVLFVVGDHSLDDNGHPMGSVPIITSTADTVLTQVNRRSQVPLDDVISMDKMHAFLTRDNQPYHDKGAGEATLEDLRSGPVVLFAGFDNRWSVQLSQQLPFRLVPDLDNSYASIVDARLPTRRWTLNFAQPVNHVVSDYGIVARYFDPMLEHNVLIVAGIGSMGTAAASEFVTEDRFSREIVKAAPPGWKDGNFEVVFSAPVVDGQAGPPSIIASAYW